MIDNAIVKRAYYKIEVENISPLATSSGERELTDSDLLRNADGICFVPGTSLAGAFRNALKLEKKSKGIMGFSDGEDGKMSGIYISDLYFNQNNERPIIISVRDGVQLEKRVVNEKFDMEIVETGVKGFIFINYIVRSTESEDEYRESINKIIAKISSGDIRIGGNKNRGFGRLKVISIQISVFNRENVEEYIEFKNTFKDSKSKYQIEKKYDEWIKDCGDIDTDYVWVTVPLKLTGGISIRRYSTIPGKANYSHITCNGKPVIPGTSWNGAIRSEANKILKSLGCNQKQTSELIDDWFGSIKKSNDDSNIHQSRIVINESILENSKPLPMTRNRINRFDASTRDGALYSEISYFGGTTNLEIGVMKKDIEVCFEILGIINLIVNGIQNGYISVGGQTAVGRGIFEANGDIKYSENILDRSNSALYHRIKETICK